MTRLDLILRVLLTSVMLTQILAPGCPCRLLAGSARVESDSSRREAGCRHCRCCHHYRAPHQTANDQRAPKPHAPDCPHCQGDVDLALLILPDCRIEISAGVAWDTVSPAPRPLWTLPLECTGAVPGWQGFHTSRLSPERGMRLQV